MAVSEVKLNQADGIEKLRQRIDQRFATIDAAGLRRELAPAQGIDLCSNDYLALSSHPLIKARMAEAVMAEGCGATASRLLRGERKEFTQVEQHFARFKKTAAALYFSSGYAANLGTLTSFLEKDDLVFSDELNHASLIDGLRLSPARVVIFPHCDVEKLKHLVRQEPCLGQRFLVTESIFSMNGDSAPLIEYAHFCQATGTALIVDEAHAVGIYGKRGSGLIEATGIADSVFLSINPAGKALGVSGAFVAGQEWAIKYLIQTARTLIFSTAPPPALAAALDTALTIIETEPQRRLELLAKTKLLRDLLREKGVIMLPGDSQIVAIPLGDNLRAVTIAKTLQAANFDLRAIRPPTVPVNTARLRVSLNINLTPETLHNFSNVLSDTLRKF